MRDWIALSGWLDWLLSAIGFTTAYVIGVGAEIAIAAKAGRRD